MCSALSHHEAILLLTDPCKNSSPYGSSLLSLLIYRSLPALFFGSDLLLHSSGISSKIMLNNMVKKSTAISHSLFLHLTPSWQFSLSAQMPFPSHLVTSQSLSQLILELCASLIYLQLLPFHFCLTLYSLLLVNVQSHPTDYCPM